MLVFVLFRFCVFLCFVFFFCGVFICLFVWLVFYNIILLRGCCSNPKFPNFNFTLKFFSFLLLEYVRCSPQSHQCFQILQLVVPGYSKCALHCSSGLVITVFIPDTVDRMFDSPVGSHPSFIIIRFIAVSRVDLHLENSTKPRLLDRCQYTVTR